MPNKMNVFVKIFCIVGFVLAFTSAAQSLWAGEGWFSPYLEARLGGSYTQIDSIRNTTDVANPAPVNMTSTDDLVAVMGLAAGMNFKKLGVPVRSEIEYAYHTELNYNPDPVFVGAGIPTRAKTKVDSHVLLANFYYDIETGTAFTPYVGAGLGAAWNVTKATGTVIATGASAEYNRTTVALAWDVCAGCAYALSDKWKITGGYRFLDLGKVVWGDHNTAQLTSKEIVSHEVLVGLRYEF